MFRQRHVSSSLPFMGRGCTQLADDVRDALRPLHHPVLRRGGPPHPAARGRKESILTRMVTRGRWRGALSCAVTEGAFLPCAAGEVANRRRRSDGGGLGGHNGNHEMCASRSLHGEGRPKAGAGPRGASILPPCFTSRPHPDRFAIFPPHEGEGGRYRASLSAPAAARGSPCGGWARTAGR